MTERTVLATFPVPSADPDTEPTRVEVYAPSGDVAYPYLPLHVAIIVGTAHTERETETLYRGPDRGAAIALALHAVDLLRPIAEELVGDERLATSLVNSLTDADCSYTTPADALRSWAKRDRDRY